ncbi:MAG: nitroreductase family protein [Ilumatobacteraceae bacterium]
MDLAEVVRRRRMARSFTDAPIDADVIRNCVDLASRAPSAGKSQGWSLLVLEGSETERYWNLALPGPKRAGFAFPGLLRAPFLAIVAADPEAYLERYSEPDKTSTGLGASLDAWPAPYWTIDASFATMVLLLAFEDAGLGALFFAHSNEDAIRSEFGVPERVEILGVIVAGHRTGGAQRRGRSAERPRRTASEIIRRREW